jgi:type II secretory pathway pseudopilin PulG
MKNHKLFVKIKKIISEKNGMSYIELSIMLVVIVAAFAFFIQIYGMLTAQTLISNTARNLLRHVELAGGATYPSSISGSKSNVVSDVKDELSGSKDIDTSSIQVFMSSPNNVDNSVEVNAGNLGDFQYQVRTPIKLTVKAKYKFFDLIGGITIGASFQGASEKFFKDLNYDPIYSKN